MFPELPGGLTKWCLVRRTRWYVLTTATFEPQVLDCDNIAHLAYPIGLLPVFPGLRRDPVSIFEGGGEERRRDAEAFPTPSPLLPPPSFPPPPLSKSSPGPRAPSCGSKPADVLG